MSQGQLGVIHPRGSMGPKVNVSILNNQDSFNLSFEQAIDYLRGQELAFYHSFFPDVNDLPTFLARIRALFAKNANDKAILERLRNTNLKRFLPDYKPPTFERGYRLVLKGNSALLDFSFANDVIQVKNGKIYISIIPENAQIIKRVLNQGLNRQSNFNAFENNDKITKNLSKILTLGESGSKNLGDAFRVEAGKKPIRKEIQEFDVIKFASKANGQGYWTKKELAELAKNPNSPEAKQARRELVQSIQYIHNFLFKDYNNASPAMQKAMKTSWSSLMGGKDVLQQDFFFEGENYTKIILGQIGEFANLVFDNFLKFNAADKALPPALIQIIGSNFENGQQYHSDLEILLACGASVNQQTKNIGEDKKIPVNTNAALVAPIFGDEVVSPLVNYFAAKDYASIHNDLLETFKKIFEQYFYAAMNLNIDASLNARQMNTFYFIGGVHLVPASEILMTLKTRQQTNSGPKFNISGGGVASYTEEGYENAYKKHYIWKYPEGVNDGSQMIPSSYNEPLYQKGAASISIQTSFSIPALLKSGNFMIF